MLNGYPTMLVDVVRLAVWLTVLVVLFGPLERLFAVRPHRIWRRGILTDLCYYFINNLVPALVLSVPISLLAWLAHRVVPAGVLTATAALPLGARVVAGLVAGEFGYYWGHRWCHEVPLLWRFHAIHHSAEEMDFLVHTRAHPLDMVFGRFCGLVPLYVLGLANPVTLAGSLVPALVAIVGSIWGFFIHANLRWRFGPLEWLVATPAFHHWHHTRSGPINRNYSSSLPWLDWAFGSLYLPPFWPNDYGIREPMPDALVDQLVHPLYAPTSTAVVEEAPARAEANPAVSGTPLAP